MEVLVIGGGASGMMAAISAASMGAYVTLYEKENELGRKLLKTGNGKCNLGNRNLRTDLYHSADNELLDGFFIRFDEDDTVRTFRSLGLVIKETADGYFYPFCDQASVVRDILEDNVRGYGIDVKTGITVDSVEKTGPERFIVKAGNITKEFDRVILACGSYAGIDKKDRIPSDKDGYALAYSLGHTVLPVKPALTALNCREEFFRDIAGVRTQAMITLLKNGSYAGSEFGELQITEHGLSGIPVFQLSHYVGADPDGEYEITIDFMPGTNEDDYIALMQSRMLQYQGSSIRDFMLGTINTKLCELLIHEAGLSPDDILDDSTEDAVINLVGLIRGFTVKVKNTRDFLHAQCCSGGIPLREIKDNCESVKTPGLFLCGEMLDVDGACGGYNLQWAWTSGYIAGNAAGCY